MPQLGETVVEGTITKWLKHEGDTVERDEPLFEISTDKVDTEVPSPLAGKLVQIKVPEGETVNDGTELAIIEEAGGNGQAAAPRASAEAEAPAQEAAEEEEPEELEEPEPQEEQPEGKEQPPEAEAPPAPVAEGGPRSQILSPLVRRLAEENSINLS